MPGMCAKVAAPGLVARKAEREALLSAIEQAAAGRSATVLVAGDAGVGKSRLVATVADEAQAGGVLVLAGRCVDIGEGELPYAPIAAALRGLAAQLSSSDLDEVLGPARSELGRLVPDLARAESAPAPAAAGFGKARLFEQVLGLLGRLGERQPVLLVVEDLHWADGSTRDLLRFLVRAAATERLALVATYRTDDLAGAHPLRPYLVELGRDPKVTRIDLPPFTRAEFADHVAAVLGGPPEAALLDRLYRRSEGNAFFTEELLAAGEQGSGELPVSLRDAMLVRLERLSEPARDVIRVVAAAGRRVDHRLINMITVLPEDELSAALREAVDAGVLAPVTRGGAYEFRHALLREAAYAELLPGEREPLHAALARELDAQPELVGSSATLAAELAYHWWSAGELGLALSASVRAGKQAEAVYAHPEALRHFQRALELWERVPPSVPDGFDRVDLTISASEAANASGEHELAIALADRAVELVDARAEPVRAGVLMAWGARCLEEAGRGDDARRRSAQALELIPDEPTPERARVLEGHARLLLLGGWVDEARDPIEQAVKTAQILGARDLEAAALTTRIITLHGHREEAVAAGERALRAAREAGDPETLLRAYVNTGETLDQAGRLEEAIELALEGVEFSRAVGAERGLGARLKAEVASRLAKLGRLDEAAALAEDVLRAAPSGTLAVWLRQTAAVVAAHRGDAAGTAAAARHARANAADAGGGMWNARGAAACAELELWQGDPHGAAAIVDEALAQLEDAEFILYSAPLYALGAWAHVDGVLKADALGDAGEARRLRELALALHDRIAGQVALDGPPEPAAYRAQVVAEFGRLGDPPDAGAWSDARVRWESLGFAFHAALCGWREAEAVLAREGDRARAGELLRQAAERARAIGAAPLVAQAELLARRARLPMGEADPDATPTAAQRVGLSPRELDVLELVVDGRTNREIGSALFISEKTVSVHVSRILAKLGAANRAEAATIAHRIGLSP